MNDMAFLKMARGLLDHDIWLAGRFSRGQAWLDLIGLANWKDSWFFIRGNKIVVKRGQVGWSIKTLANRWKWDRETVSNFLRFLVDREMIAKNSTTETTIITILNYAKWQDKPAADSTTEPQQTPQQTPHIRRSKEVKKNKNTTLAQDEPVLVDNSVTKPYKIKDDIGKVVAAYKQATGYAIDNRAWDKLYQARYRGPAKDLMGFFGSWEQAVECISELSAQFKIDNLSFTLETIVRHAASWLACQEEQNGLSRSQSLDGVSIIS